ncbi:MAG: dihydroxyacetone kinase subunit DhaL [Clostridia bacterium]|jgi:dihydroxyacetone kinase-like protein
MKEMFTNKEGSLIVYDLIKTIQINKQYLSDIDGMIGDGDHGINMNKGFSICGAKLAEKSGDLSYSMRTLSEVLVEDIGGSMGPLYGMFFIAMADECENKEMIDSRVFYEMLKAGEAGIRDIGSAEVGDKTMLDTLVPAVKAFHDSFEAGSSFHESLDAMKEAAIKGMESTKDLVAKVGRASRLGERSRGYIDAGAASACLIFSSMADTINKLLI